MRLRKFQVAHFEFTALVFGDRRGRGWLQLRFRKTWRKRGLFQFVQTWWGLDTHNDVITAFGNAAAVVVVDWVGVWIVVVWVIVVVVVVVWTAVIQLKVVKCQCNSAPSISCNQPLAANSVDIIVVGIIRWRNLPSCVGIMHSTCCNISRKQQFKVSKSYRSLVQWITFFYQLRTVWQLSFGRQLLV